MRAKDFLIVESYGELFEVNMSPSNLKKLASQTDAKVGIEFEMIVPNVGNVDDEYEQEPDYDYDERTDDIDDIIRFFRDVEYNDRGSVDYLHDKLREEYNQWVAEKANEKWEEDKLEKVYEYIKENYDEEDLADELEIEPDLFGNRVVTKDMIKDLAVKQVEEEGSYYDEARDEYTSEIENDPYSYDLEESVWLEDTGLRYMSDVESRYSDTIMWPHWQGGGGDAEYNLEQLSDEFSEVIGRRVHYSTGYHGGPRTNDAYTIEPDSSLSGNDDDAGLEFISPPLPIDEALEDVKKIKDWADERGIYTNRSTGLHMNVSVPGFDPENLDFVKLTLLLGDKYILERFGRSANTYCRSAMDIIQEAPSLEDKELLFKKLKNNLETMASKVIHSGRVGKFTSINPKENRVEFRSPGGDWLDKNFDAIEDTLYRCVVSLDAAVDPEKYRKDYLKKLTKMFAPTKGSLEDVFVQYAAGNITRSELKFKLKTAQAERQRQKYTAKGIVEVEFHQAEDGDWIVEYDNPTGESRRIFLKRTEQVNDDNEALKAAINLEPSWFKPDDIENIVVTEFSGNKDYVVFDKFGDVINTYRAWTPLQAIDIALSYNDGIPKTGLTAKLKSESDAENVGAAPETSTGGQRFVVINNSTGQEEEVIATDSATAMSRALANNPTWDGYRHSIRVLSTSPQPEQSYKLYKVTTSGTHVFNYVAARSADEARRIAITLYPQSGTDLDIVLQDNASNLMIDGYRERQQERLDQMNQPSQPQSSGQASEGENYIVSDPGDTSGGVRFRATSPEHAIERARAAFNIPADRELEARLENG